jgi:hypothetical protein
VHPSGVVEVVELDIDAGSQSLANCIAGILCAEVLVKQLANRARSLITDPSKPRLSAQQIVRARDSAQGFHQSHGMRTSPSALPSVKAGRNALSITHAFRARRYVHGPWFSRPRTSMAGKMLSAPQRH